MFDDADDDDDDDDDEPTSRHRGRCAAAKRLVDATAAKPDKADETGRLFGRIGRFVREVVAELQKVIWPTRKELLTYTAVVIVFVAVMMTIVACSTTASPRACCRLRQTETTHRRVDAGSAPE